MHCIVVVDGAVLKGKLVKLPAFRIYNRKGFAGFPFVFDVISLLHPFSS